MAVPVETEANLWSYLTNSDGSHCPLNSQCNTANEGWCLETFRERLKELIGAAEKNPEDSAFSICPKCTRMYGLIERLAVWYLDQAGVTSPPIPAKAISYADSHLPLEVRFVPLKSNHGAVWRLADTWVIHLNSNDSPQQRRFALFHEVFHILAENHGVPVIKTRGYDAGGFVELMADCFAAAVLIPEPWAVGKWAETRHVLKMRDIFQVPTPTMLIRLKYLSLI
jgi:hypothetical protein